MILGFITQALVWDEALDSILSCYSKKNYAWEIDIKNTENLTLSLSIMESQVQKMHLKAPLKVETQL